MFMQMKYSCLLLGSCVILHLIYQGLGNKIEKNVAIIDKTGNDTCNRLNDCILYPNGQLTVIFKLKLDSELTGLTVDLVLTHGEYLDVNTHLTSKPLNACYDTTKKEVTLETKTCASSKIPPRKKEYKVTFNVFCPNFQQGALFTLKTNKGFSTFRNLWPW